MDDEAASLTHVKHISESPGAGGCLCAAIRYDVTEIPIDAGYCHCRLCQRSSGAPTLLWLTVSDGGFHYTKGTPSRYQSSETGTREFCAVCGTQLMFRSSNSPHTIDVTVATLDDPGGVKPDYHIWTASQMDCVQFNDDLPRYDDAGPDG